MSAKQVKSAPRFTMEAYKDRLKAAIELAGGPVAFAAKLETEYQLVQGWAKGSIPRLKDWPILEKSGLGMAWYLFGIDDVPDQKAIDRQALAAVVEKLRQHMEELEAVCADLISPNTEKHRRATDRRPPLRAVKK